MSETTNNQTAAATVSKKAKAKGKVTKATVVNVAVTNLNQSIRVSDKELLLALFPGLKVVFEVFPDTYRLEVNHGHASKKYSVWWKPHGRIEEAYDVRTLKQYLADKAKGIGRIY